MEDDGMPDIWFPHLGIELRNVPRVFLSIFGFDIYWYAVCIIAGVVAALKLAQWYAGKTGQKKEDYVDILLLGLVLAFIGLRIYYVVFTWTWAEFMENPLRVFNFREGGLAIYGGILGAFLAGYIMSRYKKIPFTTIFDTCAPSLPLGQAIGRWGNFFNREAFGGYTDNIFAMRLLPAQVNGEIPASLLVRAYTIEGVSYIQVHPTFFYESMWNFALMGLLIWYRPHKKFPGEVMLLYMLGYGIGRFFIEGMRVDQLIFFNTGLPASQLMSVAFVLFAVVMVAVGRVRARGEK
jgi:phosphatidylglycerol:prolipoprotein diacylglycerol transferase